MTEYADLIIELSRQAESQYWVRLSFSQPDEQAQFAPQNGPAAFDFDTLRAYARKPEEYGRELSAAVFSNEALRTYYKNCLTASGQASQELRPRILIDRSALELNNLRWETMLDLENQYPLSSDPNRPFSRFLSTVDMRRIELRSRGNLRALVVISSPVELESGLSLAGRSLAAVDVQAEAQRAIQGMRDEPLSQGILSVPELTFLADPARLNVPSEGKATLKEIHAQLLHGYDIVFLVAHGAMLSDDPNNPASPPRPYILLEKEDGTYDRRLGQDLINLIASLPLAKHPRLFVLASCQSGGQGKVPTNPTSEPAGSHDEGALAALGPQLAEAGVPAVLAMQDNVRMSSMAQFTPLFFSQLLQHGQVDKAVAVARQALIHAKADDWWVPALYLRLLGGLLWFNPGFTTKKAFEGWPGILNSLKKKVCVPILGFGLLEPILGSSREIALSWAENEGYPLDPHSQDDLTRVAQYLSIKQMRAYPHDQLVDHIQSRLIAEFGLSVDENEERPVEELTSLIADEILKDPNQPFNILARLPVKIYINANPDNLLELALRKNNRDPLVTYSRWRKPLEDAEAIEASNRSVEINVNRPLIYQLFGTASRSESLVLTEDDYFEYLMWVNNTNARIPLPEQIITSWRDDALLFLGFQLEDWSFRALFRSILYGDRRIKRDYPSVAVQLQPGGGYLNVDSARRYLADTFRSDQVGIYWGSAEDFLSELNHEAPEKLLV
jgi:hypothetical protein